MKSFSKLPNTQSISLPLFLTSSNKNKVGLLAYLYGAIIYILSNRIHFYAPITLPRSAIDNMVPFVPETVWIYISEYIFFPTIYLVSKDVKNINKYLYSILTLQTLSVAFFFIFPTVFPRDDFPLPDSLDKLTHYAFSTLRAMDSPANCLPSLHVSSCFLSAFIFLDEQKEKFVFFFTWAILIALSTLTTKQHYFIDLSSGFFLAIIHYFLFHRLVSYRQSRFSIDLAR